MIVGAVINKPVEVVPTVQGAVPTNPMMQAQLPPGIIALTPQQQQQAVTMAAPQQQPPSLLSCPPILNTTLANTKEKTPMCLINELARFNKVSGQWNRANFFTIVTEQCSLAVLHYKLFDVVNSFLYP